MHSYRGDEKMRGLVLSGGGAKGAYEVGVIKALEELGFKPNIVAGTSIGSVNAALYIQGGYRLLNRFWKSLKVEDLVGEELPNEIINDPNKNRIEVVKKVIKDFGISSNSFYKKLKKTLNEEKIRKSTIDFGLVTFNVTKMKVEMLYKDDIENGKLIDYIVASCSCFPALKGIVIEDSLYIDGAYGDNMPINMVIKKGADDIIAVNLKAIGMYPIPKTKGKQKEKVKVTYIEPDEYLGDMLYFGKKNIKKNILKGYIDTFHKYNKCFGKKLFVTNNYKEYLINKIKNVDKIFSDIYENYYKLKIKGENNKIKNVALKMDKSFTIDMIKSIEEEILEKPEEFIEESLECIYMIIKLSDSKKEERLLKIYDKLKLKKLLYFKFLFSKSNDLNEVFDKVTKGEKLTKDNISDILDHVDVSLIVRYILKLLDNIERVENQKRLKLICTFFRRELKVALFIKMIMEW